MDKELLLSKLDNAELTKEQLEDIALILNGETSEYNIIIKAFDLIKSAMSDKSTLYFKYLVILVFIVVIIFLSYRYPDAETQVWSAFGVLTGYVFGQGSQLLKF